MHNSRDINWTVNTTRSINSKWDPWDPSDSTAPITIYSIRHLLLKGRTLDPPPDPTNLLLVPPRLVAAEVEGPAVGEDGAAAGEEGRQDLCRGIPLKGQESAHHLRHYQSLRSSRRRAGSSGLTPRRLIHLGALVLLAPVLYQVMVATVRAAAGAVVAGAVVAGYVFLAYRNITCFSFLTLRVCRPHLISYLDLLLIPLHLTTLLFYNHSQRVGAIVEIVLNRRPLKIFEVIHFASPRLRD